MSTFQLKKAARTKVFLKLNVSGASGSGKTMSALLMALGLVGSWDKIAVIDSENGSASLYDHLGAFQVLDLAPPFSPERYIECIDICLKAGIECIIIDSSTHEWNGAGGCCEINENLAQSKFRGNTWSAWSITTPRHDAFVNKVLQSRCHVITCTRSKMETVMGDDKKVRKVGMKDMQRDGWEYDLTVSLNIDRETHKATPSKDRTRIFEGKDPFVITEETGKMIKAWCDAGVPLPPEVKPAPVVPIEKQDLTYTHANYNMVVAALAAGTPMDKIKTKYNISEEVETTLIAASKPAPPATIVDEPVVIAEPF